jgi:hypothetical protein
MIDSLPAENVAAEAGCRDGHRLAEIDRSPA